MKNIELTEDHKSKLLEMCKVLFPEVKIHTGMLSDGSQAPEKVLDYPVDLEWGTEWDLPYISVETEQIHWFEFCMTHLVRELMCKNTKHMQQLFMGLKHPIDYLYEEFKKLK